MPTEDIHLRDLDDPDMVTSEVIDDILERELGRGYRIKHPRESYRCVRQTDRQTESVYLTQITMCFKYNGNIIP